MGFIGRAVAPAPITANDVPDLPASKITSGQFSNSLISASSVSQHATSFDDNKIVNDLSTLGLRVHTQENLNVSNTNSASFDVFQDSSGITNLTNCVRESAEYVASITTDSNLIYLNRFEADPPETDDSTNNISMAHRNAGMTRSSTNKFGSYSVAGNATTSTFMRTATNSNFAFGSNDFTIECWIRPDAVNVDTFGNGTATGIFGSTLQEYVIFVSSANAKLGAYMSNNGSAWNIFSGHAYGSALSANTWHHVAMSRASGVTKVFLDGSAISDFQTSNLTSISSNAINIGSDIGTGSGSQSWGLDGYIDSFRVSNNARYTSDFTPHTTDHSAGTSNATGSFEGVAITAGASTSKMGAVITYQDNAGTNTLNTDIILKLSANNGSNYSTATLTALPDFATGIKMAKVNDLSVTAGTQLKYKIEFANQASGSKEARIRGVSLQY